MRGQTSDNCSLGNNNFNYNSCSRTVCTWSAAKDICANYAPIGSKKGDWRLPSYNELIDNNGWHTFINNVSPYKGTQGLQLCDYASDSNGSARCWHGINRCSGSANNYCNPNCVWSNKESSGDMAYYGDLVLGELRNKTISKAFAFSVRCTAEKIKRRVSSLDLRVSCFGIFL